MIELAFVACLAANTSICEDHSLLFANVSLMLCVLQGQSQLAAWSEDHPDWEVVRWRCRIHDPGHDAV